MLISICGLLDTRIDLTSQLFENVVGQGGLSSRYHIAVTLVLENTEDRGMRI